MQKVFAASGFSKNQITLHQIPYLFHKNHHAHQQYKSFMRKLLLISSILSLYQLANSRSKLYHMLYSHNVSKPAKKKLFEEERV